MNKCKICNTEFEGNTCPNCGNSILSNEKETEKNNQSYTLAKISLVLTGVSVFSGALIFSSVGNTVTQISIIISAISAILSLILAIISIANAKTKRNISICALVVSILWIMTILVMAVIFAVTAMIMGIACESCWNQALH